MLKIWLVRIRKDDTIVSVDPILFPDLMEEGERAVCEPKAWAG